MPNDQFKRSLDVTVLYGYLAAVAIGTTVSYDTLSELIGGDVRKGSRSKLASARRILEGESKVFVVVPRTGVMRVSDVDAVNSAPAFVEKARRAARRGAKRVAAVADFDKMPNESKLLHNAIAAQCGLIAHVASQGATKKIMGKVEEDNGQLPSVKKSLEALS